MKHIFYKIGALFLIFCLSFSTKAQTNDDELDKFNRVFNIINAYYVDSTNQSKLVEDAIIGMLKKLDPHSVYIKKEDVEDIQEMLQGNFEGIGVRFNILNDTIFIISPIEKSPAKKVGILPGDRIMKIDGEKVAGVNIDLRGVKKRLGGKSGSLVTLGIKRRGVSKFIDFEIKRARLPIYSVEANYMITPNIGYIKLSRFAATTIREFRKALAKLSANGMEDLVLDLRGNGGGYLSTAIELADEFLDENKLIVYTEGVSSPKRKSSSTSRGNFEKGKLIVLIDEGSASASEIVSGAIQDWDRGIIIGRRSFGKGLVQRPFRLPDGSLMRLTTARYYTPTGRSIQKPYDKGVDEYKKDIGKRLSHGELTNADSIKFPDSLKYYTKIKKRLIYGAGGIMPDIFIPFDTLAYTDYYREMLKNGILHDFILTYSDNNRKKLLNQYPEFKDFEDDFHINDKTFEELIKFAETRELKRNEEEIALSKIEIKKQIKAIISRDFWEAKHYYQITNKNNSVILKAIEILKDKNLYENAMK